MSRVGFVGLGNMGGHMARNLVAAGHQVKVFDLVPELMAAVDGAEAQDSAAATAAGNSIFCRCRPRGGPGAFNDYALAQRAAPAVSVHRCGPCLAVIRLTRRVCLRFFRS